MSDAPLEWAPKPKFGQVLMSLGCGGLLLIAVLGASVAAILDGEWASLSGVPIGLLFAAAFLVMGLRRDRVSLGRDRVVLVSSMMGIPVRRAEHPFGTPHTVLFQTLPAPSALGRHHTMLVLVIRGEQDAKVETFDDLALATDRGTTVAEYLGVPLQARHEPLQP